MGGCVTPVSIMWDVWYPSELHLNQKDLKSDNKRLSYGQFTNWRLRDSSEYHARSKRSISALFDPKISKIGPETTKLCPIYQW